MIAKNKEDIEAMREGGRRLARHVRELSLLVKPGVTAHELEEKARVMIEKDTDEAPFLNYPSGKRGEHFPGVLCVSVNDFIVHSPAHGNNTVIQEGDVVCLDFGVRHKGLCTDHAATVIAGKPRSSEDETLVRVTKEALAAGIAEAKVGNTTGDIGYAVEKVAKKYHFGFPRNLSGHGVGKDIHEPPYVPNFGERGKGERLAEGLVIAIEPMMTLGKGDLYVDKDNFSYRTKDGSRTAHFEHTVLITKDGPEILTKE